MLSLLPARCVSSEALTWTPRVGDGGAGEERAYITAWRRRGAARQRALKGSRTPTPMVR